MKRTTIWVSSLTLFAMTMAGCVEEFAGAAGTGSAVFCVQDDPTVNFNGVFVNFGNIQINQNTSGNNTINDNDTTGDETMATSASATMETTSAGNDTNTTSTEPTTETSSATTTQATTDTATQTVSTTETVAQEQPSSVETITVGDIDCGRVEAEGSFDGVFRGQAGGAGTDQAEECAPENPGCVADDQRGRSDSPCDRDQGFGNDGNCESIDVEAGDVDVLQFQDREAAFLAQADLEPGTIEDVCLTVDEVRVITNDGQEVDVEMQGSDLCLDGPIVIEEGKHTLVVFKVDVEQSFAQSTADRIVFNPVIRVQAAAPVTTTITVEETVTQTSVATTAAGNGTASPTDTMGTTDTTSPTATANGTASPAPTTTTAATSPTNTTSANTTASPTPTTTGP